MSKSYTYSSLSSLYLFLSTTLSLLSSEDWVFTSLYVFLTNIGVLFSTSLNVYRRQSLPPNINPWRRTLPNCFSHSQPDLEIYGQTSRLPMCLHIPHICSLPFFATSYSLNLAICFNGSLLETAISWVCPHHSYFHDGQSQPWRRASPAPSICV